MYRRIWEEYWWCVSQVIAQYKLSAFSVFILRFFTFYLHALFFSASHLHVSLHCETLHILSACFSLHFTCMSSLHFTCMLFILSACSLYISLHVFTLSIALTLIQKVFCILSALFYHISLTSALTSHLCNPLLQTSKDSHTAVRHEKRKDSVRSEEVSSVKLASWGHIQY